MISLLKNKNFIGASMMLLWVTIPPDEVLHHIKRNRKIKRINKPKKSLPQVLSFEALLREKIGRRSRKTASITFKGAHLLKIAPLCRFLEKISALLSKNYISFLQQNIFGTHACAKS